MLDQPVPNQVAKNPNIHTHKVFAAVGLILIGTIIVVAGIWYFTNSNSGSEDEATTTKVSTSSASKQTTSSATKDGASDWKTYSNKTYGFSIKIPSTWDYNDIDREEKSNCEAGPSVGERIVLFDRDQLKCAGVAHYGLWAEEIVVSIGVDKTFFEPLEIDQENKTAKLITIDGEKAIKDYTTENSEGPICKCTIIRTIHRDKEYLIYLQNKDYSGSYDPTYDEIITTFKFL